MSVASLKLCKELFELSGWDGTDLNWYRNYDDAAMVWVSSIDGANGVYVCPAYDLGYLLRKLPDGTAIVKPKLHPGANPHSQKYNATVGGGYLHVADTPEDAAGFLAIELFQQGILKRG